MAYLENYWLKSCPILYFLVGFKSINIFERMCFICLQDSEYWEMIANVSFHNTILDFIS